MRNMLLFDALVLAVSVRAEKPLSFHEMEDFGSCEALLNFIGFYKQSGAISDLAKELSLKGQDINYAYSMGVAYGQGWGETAESLAILRRNDDEAAKVKALDWIKDKGCNNLLNID